MIIKRFPDGADGGSAADANNTGKNEPTSSLDVALAVAAATSGGEGEGASLQDKKAEGEEGAVTKNNGTEAIKEDKGEESPKSQENEPVEDKPEGETEGDGQDEQEDGKDDGEEKEQTEEDKTKEAEEAKRLDKNPRFQELTKKVQELEPLANRMRNVEKWMKDNGVSADEASQALNLVTLLKNPARADEAFKVLEPIIQGLQAARGEVLPIDLQKQVDDGNVSLPLAKELAKARAQKVMNEQTQQSQGQQQFATRCAQAVTSWEEATKKTDPDFQRKLPFMIDALKARVLANPRATPEQRVQFCVEIHKEITERLGEFIPKPKARKTLGTQNGTQARTQKEPKSTLDVALDIARRTPLDD